MINVLFAFGTRPEAIKLAPVIKHLQKTPGEFRVTVCLTSQHKELLRQVTDFFHIRENIDLNVMMHNQTLEYITSTVLVKMSDVLAENQPDILLVQGDTTTVFASSLAAFYKKIPVGHVEAGLRTFEKYSPFPEELNRTLTASLTDFHFAPTKIAADNLIRENHRSDRIFITGNTIVDALLLGKSILDQWEEEKRLNLMLETGLGEELIRRIHGEEIRLITVTAHRRESFGEPFEEICRGINEIVWNYPDVEIVYPVHPNPNVRNVVNRMLGGKKRIHLIDPVRYEQLLYLMDKSYLLLTDSGGIQEEGPSLHKPVLVMREVTERPEGIESGVAKLVGTNHTRIITAVSELLDDKAMYEEMTRNDNPYGDGHASERIAEILKAESRYG